MTSPAGGTSSRSVSSSESMDSGSMRFMFSTVSSKKFILCGAPPATKMSRISPLRANSPSSDIMSRRAYPAAASLSAASVGESVPPAVISSENARTASGRGQCCMSDSASVTSTFAAPCTTAESAAARLTVPLETSPFLNTSMSSRGGSRTALTPCQPASLPYRARAEGRSGATHILSAGMLAVRCALAPSVTRATPMEERLPAGMRTCPNASSSDSPSPMAAISALDGMDINSAASTRLFSPVDTLLDAHYIRAGSEIGERGGSRLDALFYRLFVGIIDP